MIDFRGIRTRHSLVEMVSRYVELKRHGGEYQGLCPFHAEAQPSFSVFRGHDGFERFCCFGCGIAGDVIDFVAEIEGIDAKAAIARIEGGDMPPIGKGVAPTRVADESDCWEPMVPAPADAPEYQPEITYNPKRGRAVALQPTRCDTYHDAAGQVLCHVVRIDFGEGKKACITVTYCEGPEGRKVWAMKRMPEPFPLLGLRELAERPNDCVLIVSGEKCWQFAKEHMQSFVPVTWMGGDGAVSKVDVSPLRDRCRVLWPDADPGGKRAMIEINNRIEQLSG